MSSCSGTRCTSLQRRSSTQVSCPGVTPDVLLDVEIAQIETANTKYAWWKHTSFEKLSYILQRSFYTCVRWNFKWFEESIFGKTCNGNPFFTFTGHMMYLSVGTVSPGHDGAGAAPRPIASHYASRFWSTARLLNHALSPPRNHSKRGHSHVKGLAFPAQLQKHVHH